MMKYALALLGALFLLTPPTRAEKPAATTAPVAVPFELLATKHMAVMIKVNGKGPYRVVFDTGAPVTLLSTKLAKEVGLLGKNARGSAFGMFGPAKQQTIDTLEVGDLKAAKVPGIVMDHPTVDLMAKAFGPLEGIVGFPFFARYKVTLDYQTKTMTFVPSGFDPPDVVQALMATLTTLQADKNPKPRVIAPAAQWGFTPAKASADEEPGVEVKAVSPDGPAARAGLKVGDRLLTLDSRWTDSVADCFDAARYVKPGGKAVLVVRRDGKERKLTVTPEAGL